MCGSAKLKALQYVCRYVGMNASHRMRISVTVLDMTQLVRQSHSESWNEKGNITYKLFDIVSSLRNTICYLIIKRSRDRLLYTKKETNCVLFIASIWLHYFHLRENVLNENTVRTEGIQITLCFIMSYISLFRHCWFY